MGADRPRLHGMRAIYSVPFLETKLRSDIPKLLTWISVSSNIDLASM
jgi:hypothetical protein